MCVPGTPKSTPTNSSPVELTRTVVTSDAMHTQRDHVDYLVTVKRAAYVCIVKRNQPHLSKQLKALPWRQVPVADHTRERRHGRDEIRRLQVITVDGLPFPTRYRPSALPAARNR